MKISRFADEQFIAVIQEQDQGLKVSDICRKHEISNQTVTPPKIRTD